MPDYNVQHSYLSQFLSTNGDGSGQIDAIGNYLSAAESFYIEPAAGEKYHINRLIVYIEDVGAFDSGKYGKDVNVFRGIHMHATKSGNVVDLMPMPVFTNSGWGQYCYDISLHSFGGGQVNGVMVVRWTFGRALPQGLDALDADVLTLHAGDKLEVTLNDNFSGLVGHRFIVQGVRVAEN
jgi:hypothetical protein